MLARVFEPAEAGPRHKVAHGRLRVLPQSGRLRLRRGDRLDGMAGLRQKALGLAVAPLLGVLYAALSLASLGLWCVKLLALLPAFAQDPDRRRRVLQEGAVAYWIAHFVCSSMLGPLALLFVMYHGGLAGWVAGAAYLVFIFALDPRPYDGSAKKRDNTLGFMTGVVELISEYFAAELVVTEEFDPARKYIFGYHPHGILSFGFLANFRRTGPGSFGERYPFLDLRPLTLRANFYSPFFREILPRRLRGGPQDDRLDPGEGLRQRGGDRGRGRRRGDQHAAGALRPDPLEPQRLRAGRPEERRRPRPVPDIWRE